MRTRPPPHSFLLLHPPRHFLVPARASPRSLVLTERVSMAALVLGGGWWVPLGAAGCSVEVVPSLTLGIEFLGPAVRRWWALRWKCLSSLLRVVSIRALHFMIISSLFLLLESVDLLLDEGVCFLQICVHDGVDRIRKLWYWREVRKQLSLTMIRRRHLQGRPLIYCGCNPPDHGTRRSYFAQHVLVESLSGQATCRKRRKLTGMAVQR